MKIVTVVGARPQFVKAAPFSKAVAATADATEIIINTGQHFDFKMAGVFFEELGIPDPKYNLGINSLSHGAMTGRMIEAVEEILIKEAPDVVLLYGDTNSTLAGAIAAAKLFIPIAHVEAGVRTGLANPEEVNRRVTDVLSTWLFCATDEAVTNLRNEGLTATYNVGDIMFDTHRLVVSRSARGPALRTELGIAPGEHYCCLTMHRQENTDARGRLVEMLDYVHEQAAGRRVIFPVHPRTKAFCASQAIDLSRFQCVEPLSYIEMNLLIGGADLLFTDSGGLQKEAYFNRTRCVTMFEMSPWPETIRYGWNRLWRDAGWAEPNEFDDYGDGYAAEKILKVLQSKKI
jgi:UDP-GlcNAc3NAcA epimerase